MMESDALDKNSTRERIELELGKIANVARSTIPSLKEVRVFGSYEKGNWNEVKSDVDVFVEVGDEFYSITKDNILLPGYKEMESKQRREIREPLINIIDKTYRGKFKIHILSSGDVRKYWNYEEGTRGPMGKSMKEGRLILN